MACAFLGDRAYMLWKQSVKLLNLQDRSGTGYNLRNCSTCLGDMDYKKLNFAKMCRNLVCRQCMRQSLWYYYRNQEDMLDTQHFQTNCCKSLVNTLDTPAFSAEADKIPVSKEDRL